MRLSEMKLRGKGKILVKSPLRRSTKVGRNDLCPCGSGLKFKKCCWNEVTGNLGVENETKT